MANFFRPAEPSRSPTDSLLMRRLVAATGKPPLPPPALDSLADADAEGAVDFDVTIPWNPDEALRREMERLEAARNFALPDAPPSVGGVSSPYGALASQLPGRSPRPQLATPLPSLLMSDMAGAFLPGARPEQPAQSADDAEAVRLRAENEELNKLIEEMKQIFETATQQEQETSRQLEDIKARAEELEARLRERDGQLAEKDGHIEMLGGQIGELEQHVAAGTAPAAVPQTPHEEDLMRMADELEQEQVKLSRDRRGMDEERQQLREDEESLMKQMREMEVGMAKERAELARQRTELQRLHQEVRREMDLINGGDRALNDRMAQFQRRHQDVFGRGSMAPPVPPAPPPTPPAAPHPTPPEGGVRRFFGGSKR